MREDIKAILLFCFKKSLSAEKCFAVSHLFNTIRALQHSGGVAQSGRAPNNNCKVATDVNFPDSDDAAQWIRAQLGNRRVVDFSAPELSNRFLCSWKRHFTSIGAKQTTRRGGLV